MNHFFLHCTDFPVRKYQSLAPVFIYHISYLYIIYQGRRLKYIYMKQELNHTFLRTFSNV